MRKIKRLMAAGLTACMLFGSVSVPSAVQAAIVDGEELVDGLDRDPGYYILPDSSSRELSYDEVSWLSASKKQMAINEIYARHGRRFVIPQVQQYFDEKSWYKGSIEARDFNENVLSGSEELNIEKLLKATTSSDYVLEGSDTRYVTDGEMAALTKDDMQLAINEIYARHGRKFAMKEYQDYFNKKSWYQGTVEPDKFNEGVLNAYENRNIEKLLEYMKQREDSGSSSVVRFAGRYSREEGGVAVSLSVSLYSDMDIATAVAGDELGVIDVSIRIGDETVKSQGRLSKENTNTYLISDSDLNGSTLTAFSNCVILLGSCGFDDTYTLVERY